MLQFFLLMPAHLLYILCKRLSDDGDGNQDVKKAIGLLRKTTTLHVHHAFLYISLPSLLDYDVKMPNCNLAFDYCPAVLV